MSRRANVLVLGALVVVGLLRGGWWVAVTEVWSPIDEVGHVDYVAAMAEDGRPPKVGRDLVRGELLELAKESATSPWRPAPLTSDNRDPKWGPLAQSYEGVQPPAYYALLATPWKLVHGYGALTTLYILRALTLILALVTVPLVWLLARELFPDRPEAGLGAAAVLVTLGGVNANLATVTNDALVMPLPTAALWLVARTWRLGFSARNAAAVGALVGLAVLSKTTALVVLPLVALGALGPLWTRGTVARRYFVWGAQAGGVSAAIVVPWLLWNRATYDAWTASEAVDKITGPLQPHIDGAIGHAKHAVAAFWTPQIAVAEIGHHAVFWTAAGALVLGTAVVVHVRRGHCSREPLAIAWMATALPLALVMMLVIIAGVFGGASSVVGRHLYPALPPFLIAIVASLFTVVGRRIGAVVLVGMIAVGLTLERADTNRYVRGVYSRGVELGLTPVAGQTRGDDAVPGPLSVRLEADCNIGGVGIEFAGDVPATVNMRVANRVRRAVAPASSRLDPADGTFAFFAIPAEATSVNVDVPAETHIAAGFPTRRAKTLVPVASSYCEQRDAADTRFAALFHPQHPNWSRAATVAWPTAWMTLGWLCFAATAIAARRQRAANP